VGAVCFPTKDNVAEGNAYVNQLKGGDLRIMYPAPEVCLDLKSWREFYGFDITGCEGWFDIEVDTEKLTLELKPVNTTPPSFGPMDPNRKFVYDPADIGKVEKDERITLDIVGEERTGNEIIPGPLKKLEFSKVYSIDPRNI
jgi:hypothetical protein